METIISCVCVWLPRCLEFLLQSGATASLKDKQGYSPVHYAAAYGHRHCLKLVRNHVRKNTNTHKQTSRTTLTYPQPCLQVLLPLG